MSRHPLPVVYVVNDDGSVTLPDVAPSDGDECEFDDDVDPPKWGDMEKLLGISDEEWDEAK